jgi:membrane protease YdiL (CAAX protease family)
MNKETQKTLLVAALFMVLLGAVKHGSRLNPSGADIAFAIAFLFQVFVPIWLIERDRLPLSEFKICLPQNWAKDLTSVLIVSIVTLPPFFLAYYFLQNYFASTHGMTAHFEMAVPQDFLTHSIANLGLIALSEELFYRGYIQTRLLKQWPVVAVFVVTNAFFAFGHFIGDYNFARLLPFFPGLLFSYLAYRSKSIAPAVLYHGICNIFSELLRESFFWK